MSDAWFKWYPGDYLRDTKHLSCEEHGAYRQLLDVCYVRGGLLPSADDRLAIICGLPLERWLAIKHVIAAFFLLADDGWRHERVNREIAKRHKLGKKRSEIGKSGAKARWQLPYDSHGKRDGKRNGKTMACLEPEPDIEVIGEVNARAAERLAIDNEFNLTFWPSYPVKNGRKEALRAFHTARAKVPLETIMAGLNRYRAMLGAPGAPQAKYAQGWLNGERWTDENVPSPNGVAHDGRINGTKAGGKLSPGDATFAGFAIALEQFSERERSEAARDRGKGGHATEPLLDPGRRSARPRPNGG